MYLCLLCMNLEANENNEVVIKKLPANWAFYELFAILCNLQVAI